MTPDKTVAGERSVAQVAQGLSRSLRVQRRLAIAIVVFIGAAVLGWYYAHLASAAAPSTTGHASAAIATASEMKLPALAARVRTHAASPAPGDPANAPVESTTGGAGEPSAERPAALPSPIARAHIADGPARTNSPVTLRALAASGGEAAHADDSTTLDAFRSVTSGQQAAATDRPIQAGASLADTLVPTATPPVQAQVLPGRRWLLPRGSFLDCTLETAIDSSLPGMTTCVLATDVFGADGRVVLLERGTRLVGESRSDTRPGQARVAVLWTEARTPGGVVVALASPGTDALGGAGIPGDVDTHFRARFGAALLLSLIDGAINAAVAREQGSAGVVYNAQGTQSIATETLRNTIAIPPTVSVAAGARVQVLVARDVDFQGVYRLSARADR